MEYVLRYLRIYVYVLITVFFFLMFSHYSNAFRPMDNEDLSENSPSLVDQSDKGEEGHLQPINERLLDDLSPSLIAPERKASVLFDENEIIRTEFENSICFKQCHQTDEFSPSDNTAKQWIILIEKNGHSIFSDIPWESAEQKESILQYLLKNAKHSKPESAGIGVW